MTATLARGLTAEKAEAEIEMLSGIVNNPRSTKAASVAASREIHRLETTAALNKVKLPGRPLFGTNRIRKP